MADRFPLILNTSNNQIQEIASGDNLDLTGSGIHNAGIITASSFSGPIVAGAGVSNITSGIGTFTDLRVGGDTSFSEDFIVTGNARVTGILTVGTSSIILNDSANTIKVGTALTLGHTQGVQFHTQNLHSEGFEVNQINASGIITATEADINGDLDVDGHTNLDNISIAGVSTFTGNIDANGDIDVDGHTNLDNVSVAGVSTFASNVIVNGGISNAQYLNLSATAPSIDFNDTNHNSDFMLQNANGLFKLYDNTNTADRVTVASNGNVSVKKDLDVDGHTNLDNVSIAGVATVTGNLNVGGVLTYEDVTNVDSVGVVTARSGVSIPDDTSLFLGNSNDLSLKHINSGTYNVLHASTGYMQYRASAHYINDEGSSINFIRCENKGVKLAYNGANKLTTETGGVNITGVCTATTFVGALNGQLGGDLDVNGNDIKSGSTIYEIVLNQRHNFKAGGNTILNINGNGVDFQHGNNTHADNVESRHGTNNDIRIYHSGSHSYLKNTTDYTLWIQNNDSQSVIVSNNSGVNKSASFNIGAAAELYHANNKKFETTSSGTHHSDFTHTFGASGAVPTLKAGGANTDIRLEAVGAGGWVEFMTTGTARWRINGTHGHFYPVTNATYDIGTSSYRVRNIYTNDLNLSNKGGANDVDNTWGDYTIQEGESDLFLINNRSGKKYKFNLTEVS